MNKRIIYTLTKDPDPSHSHPLQTKPRKEVIKAFPKYVSPYPVHITGANLHVIDQGEINLHSPQHYIFSLYSKKEQFPAADRSKQCPRFGENPTNPDNNSKQLRPATA